MDAGWEDVAVGDNSLEQAISTLRRVLGRAPRPAVHRNRAAARLSLPAPVARIAPRETDDGLDALLAPHRAFVEGRAALETPRGRADLRARAASSSRRSPRAPDQRVGAHRPGERLRDAVRDDARRSGARRATRWPLAAITRARRAGSIRSPAKRGPRSASCSSAPGQRSTRWPPPGAPSRSSPTTGGTTSASPTSAGARSGCARRSGRSRCCRDFRWRTGWRPPCTWRVRCSTRPSAS